MKITNSEIKYSVFQSHWLPLIYLLMKLIKNKLKAHALLKMKRKHVSTQESNYTNAKP